MIKDNQKLLNRLLVLIDACIIAASLVLSFFIKFYIIEKGPGIGVLPLNEYVRLLPFIVPGYLLIYYYCDAYSPKRTAHGKTESVSIIKANTIGMMGLIIVMFLVIKEINYSRWVMVLFYLTNNFLCIAFRFVLRRTLRHFRRMGYNLKHILLVGYSRAAEEYIKRIIDNPQWGYSICGILDNHVPAGTTFKNVKVLGSLGNLEIILPENKLDEIAITLSLQDYDYLEEVVSVCEKYGVHTKFIPDYNSVIPSKPYTEDLMGLPVINIRHVPLISGGNVLVKRLFDIFFSIFAIIVASPVMIVTAIAVKLSSPGPVLFKQERVGLHNKSFDMYKFRSMRVQNTEEEKKGWTTKDDPRVTKVGKFIRRTSIDELPQLFNILKGDMSIVGPRPERPQYVQKFMEEIPRYMVKHQVRPGLTGWAQVNGLRGDTSIKKRIEYDIFYIENWTFSFDIKIIFMTFFTGFINKNAY